MVASFWKLLHKNQYQWGKINGIIQNVSYLKYVLSQFEIVVDITVEYNSADCGDNWSAGRKHINKLYKHW